jgi:hypothetical protein
MSSIIPEPRLPEKTIECTYTLEERKVINPYKMDYRSQTTSALRKQIFRTKILPTIFNYWRDNGRSPENDEVSAGRIKVRYLLHY